MTDDDIKRLKRLAEQATPGPWRVNMKGHSYHEVARVNDLEIAPPNSVDLSHWTVDAAYIAAASPDVVLALLREIERLRAALTEANAQTERFEREWYLRGDEIEQLRAERNVEWSRNERATRLLSEIYKLMNPPVFAVDGKRLTFNPPGGALSALQSLSDRIRALPDELDAIDAAMKEQK